MKSVSLLNGIRVTIV